MTVAIDYFLLVGFCFAITSGLFLGLKSIKINLIFRKLQQNAKRNSAR